MSTISGNKSKKTEFIEEIRCVRTLLRKMNLNKMSKMN